MDPTRKPKTATYVYRCLDVPGVHWPEHVSDRVVYNDVKHYDEVTFPTTTRHTW